MESSFNENALVGNKLAMSQQCVSLGKAANSLLGCWALLASQIGDPCPLLSLGEAHLESWGPQCKKWLDILEQIQKRATKMIKEPEHFSYEVQAEKAWAVHYGEEKA